jgi:hypothetical protein
VAEDWVTKKDLAEFEERIVDKLTEAIRDSQTEVLRAFYNWARPIEIRLNRTDEIATRLSWIEERIAALERGKFPHRTSPLAYCSGRSS